MPGERQPKSHKETVELTLMLLVQRVNALHPQPQARKDQNPAPAPRVAFLPLPSNTQRLHQIGQWRGS